MIAARTNFSPDPIAVPDPKLFFLFDKSFLSPARLLHSLALTALFAGSFKTIAAWLPRVSKFLNLLGRNSLNVFCAASLLSLIGQITRFEYGGLVATDALIIIIGVFVMGMVAWISEWRARRERTWRPLAFALAFELVLILDSRAQEAARPVAPPPLTSACEVPADDIAAAAPLPDFAAALKERKRRGYWRSAHPRPPELPDSTGKTYPSQLEAILETALKGVDIQIVNRGVSGEVAKIAAERIPSEVASKARSRPMATRHERCAHAHPPEEFEATVRSTIRWLKENKIDIVLVGMQYAPRLARDANYSAIGAFCNAPRRRRTFSMSAAMTRCALFRNARQSGSFVPRRFSSERSWLSMHGRACRARGHRRRFCQKRAARGELGRSGGCRSRRCAISRPFANQCRSGFASSAEKSGLPELIGWRRFR